jgi:cytoskeleton protein RodZ
MASFGESLRREREMRGVTLEEIFATTKINLRFLEALEAEDFAKLPGGIFTRSFLRAYAGYLGLDAERVLAEYQLVAPPAPEGASRARVTTLAPGHRGSLTRFVPWLVAVPLLAAGYALHRYSHRTQEIAVNVAVTAPVSNSPVPTAQDATPGPAGRDSLSGTPTAGTEDSAYPAAQPNTTSSPVGESLTRPGNPSGSEQSKLPASGSTATGAVVPRSENALGSQGQPLSAPPAGPTAKSAEGDLVLEVATTERAWVAVDADGKAIFQSTLNPKEVKTFTAKDSFEVWTGNAQGTLLTLNGTRQQSLGRQGEVKRIHLTRISLQQPAP